MSRAPTSLQEDLAAQRAYVATRSPSYERLLGRIEDALEDGFEARLKAAWQGRVFRAWYERPLLLLAALRDDALREGPDHPLWQAIAAPDPDPAAATASALAEAIAPERTEMWRTLTVRHLQTNEPSRAVAWLWPAHLLHEAGVSRIAVCDVGASAGLNLVADRLPPMWEDEEGRPLPVSPLPAISRRVGFDLRPLDVLDSADARWLKACVWPGQGGREARLEEAIAAFRAGQSGKDAPTVHRASVRDVPEHLSHGADGIPVLAFQTIVRDYLPPDEWATYETRMRRWLAARRAGTAFWVELEVTEAARAGGPPAAITVHLRGPEGIESEVLAACEPHPVRIAPRPDAVTWLKARAGAP